MISAQSKFSAAMGSTNANLQDFEMFESPTIFKSMTPFEAMEDCKLFEYVTAAFVSALHAEKSSGVTPEMLAKV